MIYGQQAPTNSVRRFDETNPDSECNRYDLWPSSAIRVVVRVAAISRRTPVMRANEPKGLDWRLVIDGVLWKRLFRTGIGKDSCNREQ